MAKRPACSSQIDAGAFSTIPTPAGWRDNGDWEEPLSQQVRQRPEDLLDAFRYATEQAARIVRERPPIPVTSQNAKKRVVLALPKITKMRGRQQRLDATIQRLRKVYAPICTFTRREIVRSGRKQYVQWKVDVSAARNHLITLHKGDDADKDKEDNRTLDEMQQVKDQYGSFTALMRSTMLDFSFEQRIGEHLIGDQRVHPAVPGLTGLASKKGYSQLKRLKEAGPSRKARFTPKSGEQVQQQEQIMPEVR